LALEAPPERVRGGLGGALERSSACCSRLQIGQLEVRRL
jgi:hypothetical protein